MHRSVVISGFNYDSICFVNRLNVNKFYNSLVQIHRKFLIILTKSYFSVSYSNPYLISGTFPINYEILRYNYSFLYRHNISFDFIEFSVSFDVSNILNKRQFKVYLFNYFVKLFDNDLLNLNCCPFIYFNSFTNRLVNKNFYPNFFTSQFLTSHGKFKNYLYKLKLVSDPYCNFCGEYDHPVHVLGGYNAFRLNLNDYNSLVLQHYTDFVEFCRYVINFRSNYF